MGIPVALWVFHAGVLVWHTMKHGYLSSRHVLLPDVGLIILAAGTLAYTAAVLSRRFIGYRYERLAQRVDVLVLAAVCIVLSPRIFRDINDNRWYIHDAAGWIRKHYQNKWPRAVISEGGWAPFYSGITDWIDCKAFYMPTHPRLARVKLAVVEIGNPLPAEIRITKGGQTVRFNEVARFKDGRRGMIIYEVQGPTTGTRPG